MPLSWNEIKSRALTFSRTWSDAANEDSQGIAPIQKVVSDSIGELATASQDLVAEVEASSTSVKVVFEQGKKMIGKAAEFADKGSKVVKFSKEIYELGMNGWHFGQQLISNMTQ